MVVIGKHYSVFSEMVVSYHHGMWTICEHIRLGQNYGVRGLENTENIHNYTSHEPGHIKIQDVKISWLVVGE